MPSYHNVTYRNTALSISPVGWRRWLKLYPYSQGGRIKFRIGLKDKKQDTIPPITIYEDIPIPENSVKDKYPLIASTFGKMHSGAKFKYLDVEGSVLSVPGHGRYTIDNPYGKEAIEILTFDIKRDATMFMWLVPSVLALLSIIISVILWIFHA